MTQQKWKTDPELYDAPTKKDGYQVKKELDYDTVYRQEFLDCDPLRDWESIDRCKWLWEWSMDQVDNPNTDNWAVLDVGTKDGQFPDWLREQNIASIGLEYSEPYVRYALNKGRPVAYGNACAMEFDDNQFDYVFSHHLHGLLPDYLLGLQEMYRVSKKYMIALNQVPGNPRKHYSYIDKPKIYDDFIVSIVKEEDCKVIWNNYLDTGFNNEWVIFLEKSVAKEDENEIDLEKETEAVDTFFKRKKK